MYTACARVANGNSALKNILICHHNNINIIKRQRHFYKNMDCEMLMPPASVRGMRELNREAFRKRVQVPRLRVPEEQANRVMPLVKKLLLKMEHLRPVREVIEQNTNSDQTQATTQAYREILLHPQPVQSWQSLPTQELYELNIHPTNFYYDELDLCYANWRADEIFKSVLPESEEGLTSYSRIGHIVHLNLREHLLPYSRLIGDVLLDKVPGCRTVVNKASSIDNTYRNFQMDLICGVPEYQVETKENGIPFEFDFSRVYWNPRLSTEHDRIVKMLRPCDVLYDVFAGVGPFSVPAAKKGCHVLANDLNPESYRWLEHNMNRNKCTAHARLYNKDGRDFIMQDIKSDLNHRWLQQQMLGMTHPRCSGEQKNRPEIHITMNLPALAVEFLSAFRCLFSDYGSVEFLQQQTMFPIVHVYTFAKGENTKELARELVEHNLGMPLKDQNLMGIHFVRNVAPNKDMYRISFRLNAEILTTPLPMVGGSYEGAQSTASATATTTTRKRLANDDAGDEYTQSLKMKCN